MNSDVPAIPDHELLRRIGSGSYGEVWLARNVVGTFRAVKVVRRATFGRAEHFEREFRGIQRFEPISRSHDGFVDILQIGRNDEGGYFYYVMELADDGSEFRLQPARAATAPACNDDTIPDRLKAGLQTYTPKTLRADQQRHTRLPIADCVAIGVTLASALAYLHKHGLVHRDIKPSNIIFVGGVPKLADIGLVAEASEARSFVGTLGFIPPEGPGSPQADLYSLGKVLYEISTGQDRQDFPQLPPELLVAAPRQSAANPDSESGKAREKSAALYRDAATQAEQLIELNEVLLKACHKDLRQRYPSAEAMLADLELLQRGKSVQRKHAAERRWTNVKRVGLAAVAMVALVAVLPYVRLGKPPRSSASPVELTSLAVLPFDNDSSNKADEYLGTQMAEELGSTLAKIPRLRVIGRNSAIALKASTGLRQAAQALQLGAVLDGRIYKAENRLRVSAHLINTADGFVLWSDVYEVEATDLQGLQTRLAESVAQALHLKLTDSVRSRLAVKSTRNLEAYRLYLEGRFLWHKRTAGGLLKSIDLFQQAIRLDPDFARAYVGLADAYNILDDHGISPAKESKPKARNAVRMALALDDTLPEAHASLAKVLMEFDWDWRGAEREYKLAINMDPNYPTARQWYSQLLDSVGRPEEALEQIQIGVQLDPLSCILLVNLGMRHYFAGRFEQAIECSRKAREVDPNFGNPYFARFYEQRGRYNEAVEEWERCMRYNGESLDKIAILKSAYAQSGMTGFWRKRLELLRDPASKPSGPGFGFEAELHARLGEWEPALDCLEKGLADQSTLVTFMHREPPFEKLRSHPRFVAMLQRMGLQQ